MARVYWQPVEPTVVSWIHRRHRRPAIAGKLDASSNVNCLTPSEEEPT